MNPSKPDKKPIDPPAIFRRAFVRACIGAVVLSLAAAWIDSAPLTFVLWVTLPSLLIAALAMLPGMTIPSHRDWKRDGDRARAFLIGGVAAMVIRAVCTVALVAACRYHFGDQAFRLTLWVGFFYVVLTSIEVAVLARGGRHLDPPNILKSTRLSA